MLSLAAVGLLFFSAPLYGGAATRVSEVKVEGNIRVPSATILRHIATRAKTPYDPQIAQDDLKKLHALGLFRSLELATDENSDGTIKVTFRVSELPLVSAFAVEGVSDSLAEKILSRLRQDKLDLRPGTPYQGPRAKKATVRVRAYLQGMKFPNASVEVREENWGQSPESPNSWAKVSTEGDAAANSGIEVTVPNSVRVVLKIETGPRLEVGRVIFNGNSNLTDQELRRQMRQTRAAPFWARWSTTGAYVPEELSADLEEIRGYYRSRGHAAVELGKPEVEIRKIPSWNWFATPPGWEEKEKLLIRIPVTEGPRFQLTSIRLQGNAGECGSEVSSLLAALTTPQPYDLSLLENTRRNILAVLGRAGYALAQVQLEQAVDKPRNTVDAVYKIAPGDRFQVKDICFEGNSRLPEKFLRRELVLHEGELFDSAKLDKSIEQLNRSNLILPLQRSQVDLRVDETENTLGIVFKVKEKQRQGIYATGGAAGGGYLGMLYTAFNLLGLGEALTLELDGGAAQSNILLDLVARRFMGSPFTLALAGFQRYTRVNVASIVPDAQDLVRVFRRRSRGVGWSGGYPLTPAAQFNLSFRLERVSVFTNEGENGVAARSYGKSELTPAFTFDTTRGTGLQMRGSKLSLNHSWLGTPFLRSVELIRPSFQYSLYKEDPISPAKNSLAFRMHASAVRSLKNKPLSLETLAFPGDDVVRGFRRGSLVPWAYASSAGSTSLQPAGSDTVIGFSSEYRAPLQGPLSCAGFMDLGWTNLARQNVSPANLIEETNGVLRSSLGGELRVQIPLIHQPVRLIFAWNPLRLQGLLREPASAPIRLADPRGSIRFALGNLF